jgi:hypothetical protein
MVAEGTLKESGPVAMTAGRHRAYASLYGPNNSMDSPNRLPGLRTIYGVTTPGDASLRHHTRVGGSYR